MVKKAEAKKKSIKVILAKLGLDGHDRGVKVLTQGLREEGMEVIYTGLRQTPQDIVRTALREGAEVVGLSSMSGGHNDYFVKVAELQAKEKSKALLTGAGIIPEEVIPFLKKKGIKAIFGPGTEIKDIADFIRSNV